LQTKFFSLLFENNLIKFSSIKCSDLSCTYLIKDMTLVYIS
jgi:hypothetical protein